MSTPKLILFGRPRVAILVALGVLSLACAGLEDLPFDLPGNLPVVEVEAPPEPEIATPRFYYVPGAKGVEDASYSAWQEGDRVFIGVDGTNLRQGPVVSGDNVVEKLDLGVEVEVVGSAGGPVVLIGRRNTWYKVRTRTGTEGYLFGSVLSPLRVAAYVPGQEEPSVGVVTFSQEFGPRLRIWEPPEGAVFALDALPTSTFATGGTLSAKVDGERVNVSICDPSTNRCSEAIFGFQGEELMQLSPPTGE